MNTTILEPYNRLHLPGGLKVSAVHADDDKVYLGLTNGDVRVMRIAPHMAAEPARPEARSIKSFRSFNEVRRLFPDNETSQALKLEKTFVNVSKTQAPITTIKTLSIYDDQSREVLLIGTADLLQVYEWVGPHLNLVRSFDEIRAYSQLAFVEPAQGQDKNTRRGSPAESSNGLVNTSKLLLVSSRKRLHVYRAVHRSRNIFDFVLEKELLMRDRIKSLCVYPDSASALIATVQTVSSMSLTEDFSLSDVDLDTSNTHNFTQISSFSYFGLAGAGPGVFIVPISASESIFVRDTEVGVLRLESGSFFLKESEIRLSAPPVNVAFLSPCYIVFVYAKTFDVVDSKSGAPVQTFKHGLKNAATFFVQNPGLATLAAGSDVFQLKKLPVQEQLDNFLAMRGSVSTTKGKRDPTKDLRLLGLEWAIVLVEALEDNDDFFADKSDSTSPGQRQKQKQLYLRDLYTDKVVVLFEKYSKYREALAELASEWMVPFQEVLQLFPDFLNGGLQIKSDKGKRGSAKHSNPIKKITADEISTVGGSASENADKTAASSESEAKSETKKDTKGEAPREKSEHTAQPPSRYQNFHKAVQNLIVFLTDQRRVHLSFLSSPEDDPSVSWKALELRASDLYPGIDRKIIATKLTEYASAIDTSLFLCYYFTRPMMLGPLLRLPHNRCNARVVNDCLLNNSHLESRDQLSFIGQLLDFYFGRALHDEALRLLRNLASEHLVVKDGNPNVFLTGPALSVQYMQRLSNEYLELIFKYAHWVLKDHGDSAMENTRLLFMNDTFECESYDRFRVLDFLSGIIKRDDLAVAYLEWLLFESGYFSAPEDTENMAKSKSRDVPRLSTRLCLLYLKQMKALHVPEKAFSQSRAYRHMEKLLSGTTEYEPWTVLKSVPPSEDKYLRLTVYIYHRLGEHQKSLDILYNQLGDLDQAMQYCAQVYDEPQGKETGQRLLFKLLEDLLMHYNENQDSIARLLALQGQKMPTLQILNMLPDSFPLYKLLGFLKTTTGDIDERQFSTQMKGQLHKVSASKARYNLVMAQARHFSISEPSQPCGVCFKPVGHSVTCVGRGGSIIHYGCLDKEPPQLEL